MSLTILGLGPGDAEDITRRAWRILHSAPVLLLRTAHHPLVEALERDDYTAFDAFYNRAPDFETLYKDIAKTVWERAQAEDIVYAVPGHPLVGESTVGHLLALAGDTPVTIVDGLSFIEPALSMLGVDGMAGLQVYDALDIASAHHPPLNPDTPALLGQVYNRDVAAHVKLTLMNGYPDEHPVTLLHTAGTAAAIREDLPLYAIDRSEHIAHLSALYVPPLPVASSFARFQETIAHLRAPEGCPWDREQTHQSLRPYLLEETYEVLEALDNDDPAALREELGDLLLQVVLHSQIATEDGTFSMANIIATVNHKIIHRHPHVWGTAEVNTTDDLKRVWEAQKQAEKADAPPASILGDTPPGLPALMQAYKYQKKAARVGFDWETVEPVIAKVFEEIEEVRAAATPADQAAEMGDVLFALVNWARWLGIDPETALRETNARFRQRFTYIENRLAETGRALDDVDLSELDALWEAAKAALKP